MSGDNHSTDSRQVSAGMLVESISIRSKFSEFSIDYSASSLNIPIYHILPTRNVFAHKNKTIDVTIINFGERVDTSI